MMDTPETLIWLDEHWLLEPATDTELALARSAGVALASCLYVYRPQAAGGEHLDSVLTCADRWQGLTDVAYRRN